MPQAATRQTSGDAGPAGTSFATIPDLIRQHARQDPLRPALEDGQVALTYGALDERMDRIAAALQARGLQAGEVIAICALPSTRYAEVFLGALRAGIVVAPLAPGSMPESLARMCDNAQARMLFFDQASAALLSQVRSTIERVGLDTSVGGPSLQAWLAATGSRPAPVSLQPESPFNIIYSSGTTGEPKGIVQSHGMRWAHVRRWAAYGYGEDSVTLLATPLYSNTTLVVFFPALGYGGRVHLMPKFDAASYLALAQRIRATHTMLVPVQYQRLMAHPDFGAHDLSAFLLKFCTSAPFAAALKAQVLARWPGGLVESYGLTEGGGTCILEAHVHTDKLHSVGRPAAGSDIRILDEEGQEVPSGEAGEVVGHSAGMMIGYHRLPEKTREVEWFDATGKRFIRTGDIGRLDDDGFLTLIDRKKDMIISGGFNIYPSDVEAVLRSHDAVADVAVVGVPSEQWGETPVAFVVLRVDWRISSEDLLREINARLGKTQRLSELTFIDVIPRSPIGKVLKRELSALVRREIAPR
jgi:acyl-CoA synthetase (AMP-forming)/AMP-acid ligase II